jgi:hypothetical protein
MTVVRCWPEVSVKHQRRRLVVDATILREITAESQRRPRRASRLATALVAGNVYACGIEEAPSHIASAQAEFRALSRS